MDKNFDIPLHDIKPLVEIQEYSMEYLILLSVVALLVAFALVYLFVRWLQNRRKFSLRKEHLKELKNLNIHDTKNAAYKLTLYGHTFKHDTQRHQEAYQELFENLEKYKYKKEIEAFDDETLHFIRIYQGMLDE